MKRSRSSSPSASEHDDNPSSTPSDTHQAKYSRRDLLPSTSDSHLTCQLPPTCDSKPNTFETYRELQTHYDRCHLNVCEAGKGEGKECGKVFPDGRLLDLHIIENHDSSALIKQESGGKIFECFLPRDVCDKTFVTPKERRNHMIKTHHFSKQYFFSVTNHGIGEMVERFGSGASMIRPVWKGRDEKDKEKEVEEEKMKERQGGVGLLGGGASGTNAVASGSKVPYQSLQKSAPGPTAVQPAPSPAQPSGHPANPPAAETNDHPPPRANPTPSTDLDMDAITSSMAKTSLTFVPKSVVRKQKVKDKDKETGGKMEVG